MVETRLYEAEALLGILQSLPEEKLQAIFREMSTDALAGPILERTAHGPHGPLRRDRNRDPQQHAYPHEADEHRESDNETESLSQADSSRDDALTTEWRNQLIAHLAPPQNHASEDVESEDEEDEEDQRR